MFFTAKKLISSLFLTITLSSVLFLLPIDPTKKKINVANGANAILTALTKPEATTPDTVISWGTGSMILNWILDAEYAIIIGASSWLFAFAGNIFDTLWAFGLSSESYNQKEFIGAGWIVCRDISNTFFIFILLYIAITTILGLGDNKKLLSTIVVVALLMNFSLYITRFVIDIGNMFAIEFYSTFPADKADNIINIPGIERHRISAGFTNALIKPLDDIKNRIPGLGEKQFSLKATMIVLVGIEFLVVTFVFLISSFLLIGRIATLWILMILSPLAFFSITIPPAAGVNIWGRWKGELIKQTFFPAIFLFFLYFAARLANGSSYILTTFDPNKATGNTSEILRFVPLGIQFAIIIAFILYGLKLATSMSGTAGKMAATWGGTAFLGGAALAGRQVGGRLANWATKDKESGGLGLGQSLSTSRIGRFTLSGINKVAEGTWDARATSIGKNVASQAGVSLGQVGGQGGFAKEMQESDRKYKATYDSLKGNPEAQAKMVANMRKLVGGARINPDRDVKTLMSNLSVRERMELIEKAQGTDKEYLSKINKGLAEEALPEKRKADIKSEYDFLKDKPKAQAEFIANLHTSGQKEQIAPLMGKLSAKERYNAIKESSGDTRAYLEEVNKEVMAKMKPDQKEKDKKEWKEEENFGSFKSSLEDYKKSRKLKEEAEKAGDLEQKEIHKKAMEEYTEAIVSKREQLRSGQITDLDAEDLLEDPIATNLSFAEVKSIQKKSDIKFNKEQSDKFYQKLLTENKQKGVADFVDLSVYQNAKEKKTEEGKEEEEKKKKEAAERKRKYQAEKEKNRG